uniref:Leucine rich immune protein (Coil-less) n=1 Tax=Anopheles maculatus TaxID=74869 RepID=A0A182SK62_9DIPT
LLLVLNAAKHYATIRLTCENRFCTIFNLASSEETFVYQYISKAIVKVHLENVLLERVDKKVLEEYPPFVECADVQNSCAMKVMSVPMNVSCLRIVDTGLSKLEFEERCKLSRLYVEKSKLSSIPRTIRNARSLTFIEITETNVRYLNLATFCDHALLQCMVLKRNRIRYVLNGAARSCPLYDALTFLKLSENRLKSLNLMMFDRFSRMHFLDFSHNRLASVNTGTLTLPTVERFQLSNNRLTGIAFCTWMLPGVSSLMLRNNALTSVPPCMQSWTNITFLSLAVNKLSQFSIDSIANMDNLLELNLASNRLESVRLSGGQFPSSLQRLDISANLLHQLDLSFVPVRSLTVEVGGNDITGFDINSTCVN